MINQSISDSQFYMWRAVIAMVHADGVVTPHETAFIQDAIKDLGLSEGQLGVMSNDLKTPQDSYEMFSRISDVQDKKKYFSLARAIGWSDGDLDKQERLIIKNLEKIHMNEEEMEMLDQSRSVVHEIELNQDQWRVSGVEPRKSIFSFLIKDKVKTI